MLSYVSFNNAGFSHLLSNDHIQETNMIIPNHYDIVNDKANTYILKMCNNYRKPGIHRIILWDFMAIKILNLEITTFISQIYLWAL